MDCSPPGSSVHGMSQARILKWVAFPSPGDLPNSGIKPMSPALAGGFFTNEPSGKPQRFGHAFIQSETSPHGLTAYWVPPSHFPFLQEVWATSSLDPGKVSHGAGGQNQTWLQASTLPLTNAEPSSIASSLRLRFFICKTGLMITSWQGIILNEIWHVISQVRGLARADNNLNELLSFSPTSQREPRLDAARLGGHQAKKTRGGKLW